MEFLRQALQTLGHILTQLQIDAAELARVGMRVAVIWVMVWLALRALRVIAKRIVAAADDGDPRVLTPDQKRERTIAQLVRGVGRVVILFIGVLLTLNVFIEIGPLLAGAGIVGLAISFGAQSLVKDVLSGFFILFEDQFAVGDIVELGGKGGVVERMTLRVVVLRDVEGVLHTIPNGEIGTVSNKTRGWSRAVIEVGVAYGESVDRALSVFRDEAQCFGTDPAWTSRLDGLPEVMGVERLDDSAVVIRTVLRCRPGEQWGVAREYRRRIKNRLDREGIEIPFPQRTVHLRPAAGLPDGLSG